MLYIVNLKLKIYGLFKKIKLITFLYLSTQKLLFDLLKHKKRFSFSRFVQRRTFLFLVRSFCYFYKKIKPFNNT